MLTSEETTLSYASVTGLQKDLGLVGDDYQWLGSTFYFGRTDLCICAGSLIFHGLINLQRIPGLGDACWKAHATPSTG